MEVTAVYQHFCTWSMSLAMMDPGSLTAVSTRSADRVTGLVAAPIGIWAKTWKNSYHHLPSESFLCWICCLSFNLPMLCFWDIEWATFAWSLSKPEAMLFKEPKGKNIITNNVAVIPWGSRNKANTIIKINSSFMFGISCAIRSPFPSQGLL